MENADWGAASLIPTLLVFGLAIWTRRPIESLLSGALLGLAMLHGTGFVAALADTSVDVMTDPDVAWVILVCGLMGGVIGLLLRTAATRAFTNRIAAGVGSARGRSWRAGCSESSCSSTTT
jgi:Na+/H+ antiporter NhaC